MIVMYVSIPKGCGAGTVEGIGARGTGVVIKQLKSSCSNGITGTAVDADQELRSGRGRGFRDKNVSKAATRNRHLTAVPGPGSSAGALAIADANTYYNVRARVYIIIMAYKFCSLNGRLAKCDNVEANRLPGMRLHRPKFCRD